MQTNFIQISFKLCFLFLKKDISLHIVDREMKNFNTLRTDDADLRFYITTVQDG